MKLKKGFTLIELLVVIAVIGILATIVLINLSTAQDRAKDVRVQAGLSQIRALAEMEATPLGDYDGVCTAITASAVYLDISDLGTDVACYSPATNPEGWCAHVTLPGKGVSWCVDREVVKEGSCAGTGSIVCTTSP